MKPRYFSVRGSVLVAVALFTSIGSCAVAQKPAAQAALSLASAPEAVKNAAKKDMADGTLKEVKLEKYDDAPAYEVIYVTKGREYERVYSADGNLLVAEEVMNVSEAPAAVQAAILKAYGHQKVKVEKMIERGVTYFEAGADGKEMLFTPEGAPRQKPIRATR